MNMPKLPLKLNQMLTSIEEEQELYPGREQELASLQKYIDTGDLFMAESTAERIIEQQRALKHTREHGLPAHLQQLCDSIRQEAEPYSGRERELESLQKYIDTGDHFMAKATAERIIEQQRTLKHTREHGLPAHLQQLCDCILQEAEPYSGREQELASLQKYIDTGDHFMAESTAERIIEQQRTLKHTREHGLPAHLQQLCDSIRQEAESYSGREQELASLQKYIDTGDHFMAESTAERIIEQQRTLKHTRENGLPAHLQQLCDSIRQEAESYSGREQELASLQKYIDTGDHFMAESTAERIIEQQRALKHMRDG